MFIISGEFVDDYTVRVIDVFAMPQTGTGVSVEAVDPVFQAKMLDMLKQTGRPEMVVGWSVFRTIFFCKKIVFSFILVCLDKNLLNWV